MLRTKHLRSTGPARTRPRRLEVTQTTRIGAARMQAYTSDRPVLLDADVTRLQLFLAAYTAFTEVDARCLERLAAKLELATVLSAGQIPSEVVRMRLRSSGKAGGGARLIR